MADNPNIHVGFHPPVETSNEYGARGRQNSGAGDFESHQQENCSWKDQSRSPSSWRYERDSSAHPPTGQSIDAHQRADDGSLQRRHQYRDRERNRSSSRDRGKYRSYRSRDRDRNYISSSRGPRFGSHVKDALSYDDDDDNDAHRDEYRSGYGRRDWDRPSSPRDQRERDRDRNDDYYRGRRADGLRRGRRSESPGQPSDTVMVDGISPDVEENELRFGLSALQVSGLQDIRIRRERNSARRIAFLEFGNVGSARDFVESYPDLTVSLQLPAGTPIASHRVRISYSWSKRDDSWKDWKCENCRSSNYSSRRDCFRCGDPRPQASDSPGLDDGPPLSGEKDACPQQKPYPIVVITGLDGSTSEEVFAKGVMKLFVDDAETAQPAAPSGLKTTAPVGNTKGLGARRGSLRRVFIIRDRISKSSWKYGFAEFATTEDASKAVTKFQASPRFTIASKPVTVAFIHTGVFVPVFPPEPQIEPFVFGSLHNPDVKLRYWEYRAYAHTHVVSMAPIVDPVGFNKSESLEKKDKKRKADKEAGGTKKKTLAMAPQMKMWANKSAEIRGETTGTNTPQQSHAADVSSSSSITVVVPKALENKAAQGSTAAMTSSAATLVPVGTDGHEANHPPPSSLLWSFADPKRMCCLLCQRKFKSMEMVRKHEVESDLHKANLQDDEKMLAAKKSLAAVGLEPIALSSMQQQQPQQQYRDRARERRETHGQPKKPSASSKPQDHPDQLHSNGSSSGVGTGKALSPEPPTKMSKGMAMLSKMGLRSGEGLGVDGSGRQAVVATELYRPGVGLGAEGAKVGDAEEEGRRNTEGKYGDFLERTREKARERFEKMA